MLSKVAERLYWMTRYLERAEDSARLVRVYGGLFIDLPRSTGLGWAEVLDVLGSTTTCRALGRDRSERTRLKFLLADTDNPGSVLTSIRSARENARTTRDVIPTEAWQAVNELYLHGTQQLRRAVDQRHRDEVLTGVVERSQQITGMLSGTMSHGPAYQFVRMGRYLERADMTSRVIESAAGLLLTGREELTDYDNTLWMAVLRCLSGYQMYRQYVRRRINAEDVIGFLLKDTAFPRSLSHCVRELEAACGELPNAAKPRREAVQLGRQLDGLKPGRLEIAELHALLDELQLQFAGLHEALAMTWFRPSLAA